MRVRKLRANPQDRLHRNTFHVTNCTGAMGTREDEVLRLSLHGQRGAESVGYLTKHEARCLLLDAAQAMHLSPQDVVSIGAMFDKANGDRK